MKSWMSNYQFCVGDFCNKVIVTVDFEKKMEARRRT